MKPAVNPAEHECQPGDLEGFESPQRSAIRCRVCKRAWWPVVRDGQVVTYTVSSIPRRRAA